MNVIDEINFCYCTLCGNTHLSEDKLTCLTPGCQMRQVDHLLGTMTKDNTSVAICPYSEIDALKLSDSPYEACDVRHPLNKYYRVKDKEARDRVIVNLPNGAWPRSLTLSA